MTRDVIGHVTIW